MEIRLSNSSDIDGMAKADEISSEILPLKITQERCEISESNARNNIVFGWGYI